VLTVAAAGYFSGKLSLEDARSYLFAKICIDNDGEMTELRQEIYIIDDECDWEPGMYWFSGNMTPSSDLIAQKSCA